MNVLCSTLCLLVFSYVGSSVKQWYEIPNHNEEVFLNFEENITSSDEAEKECAYMNAISLVLWKTPVIEFVAYLFSRIGHKRTESTCANIRSDRISCEADTNTDKSSHH